MAFLNQITGQRRHHHGRQRPRRQQQAGLHFAAPHHRLQEEGQETIASICAQKEQMEVQIEREERDAQQVDRQQGTGIVSWRRTKKKPTTSMAATSASTS
jgi:hypothetical protein